MTFAPAYPAHFKAALASRNLVFVFGSGVSAALSGGSAGATWGPLIAAGVEHAMALGADPEWGEQVSSSVSYGTKAGNLAMVVSGASNLEAELKRLGAFESWIRDTVGALRVKDPRLSRAISALPFPVLTTNYDKLLEHGGRPTAVWTRATQMQAILATSSNAIGHLHGVWDEPESIVFSEASYARLLQSEAAQHLQQAASSLKSVIYVGFGAGIDDPNFAQLLDWHRSRFQPSAVTHFRFCLESEVEELTHIHARDSIEVMPYGSSYGDLCGFLERLVPIEGSVMLSSAGIVRDPIGEAQSDFLKDLQRESVIAELTSSPGEASVAQFLIPPVLLPVPQSEFTRSKSRVTGNERVQRLDPGLEIRSSDFVLLAGEEGHGVTTAIKWLGYEASRYLGSAVPLYVSFQRCRGARPLEEQLRREAVLHGVIAQASDPLPPYVLILDDFTPFVERISDRVTEELGRSSAILTIVGCRQGVEDEVLDRLRSVKLTPVVRYVGKLGSSDVREMVRLASPGNHEAISKQIVTAITHESLPKTPFTVGLLLAVLVKGGAVAANASQTSILDDYVGLMLGRGDPHDDARMGFDQSQRVAILSGLAQEMVDRGVGGLSEVSAIAAIQSVFDRLGWQESAGDALRELLNRRVLKREGRFVGFARSSFLHLFAAKRATADPAFRARLLERPIFYTQILTDYAALKRYDRDLLSAVNALLAGDIWRREDDGIFAQLEPTEPVSPQPSSSPVQSAQDDGAFDSLGDEDAPPFPVTDEVDVPESVVLVRTLELVSMVLRDSDQVEDLQLKQQVLTSVLRHWGMSMGVINRDRRFRDFLKAIIEGADNFPLRKDETIDDVIDELTRIFPAAMAFGEIGFTLSSRKLIIPLENGLDDGSIGEDEHASIAAAFFLVQVRSQGWVARLKATIESRSSVWVVRNFLLAVLIRSYLDDQAEERERELLLDLCLDLIQTTTRYDGARAKKQHRTELRDHYLHERTLSRTRRRIQANAGVEFGADSSEPSALI